MINGSNNDGIMIEFKLCTTEILFLINCLYLYFVDYIFLTLQNNNNNCMPTELF